MKATPIAEYLMRKGELPAPRVAPSFSPRSVTANDDSEPEFRRSGLVAALARRSPESPPLVRPIDPHFAPHREAPPPRRAPPPPAPEVDWEARLTESYHRGVQEGIDATKAEAATARALERAESQKRAVIEKLDFQMNEYARLSEALAAGFAELDQRVAQAAARVLQPLVSEAVTRQVLDELAETMSRLARGQGVGLIKVRGPEKLLRDLKPKVAMLAVEIEFVEEESVEITVCAQATEIRTELASLSRLIDDLVARS